MSEDDYLALILRRLEEKKVYPLAMRKRGIQGDVSVSFTVRPDGSLGALQPPANAGHPFLAQAAAETVRAASPFPVMEGRAGDYAVRITIRYQLSSAGE
jgi:protein TonB